MSKDQREAEQVWSNPKPGQPEQLDLWSGKEGGWGTSKEKCDGSVHPGGWGEGKELDGVIFIFIFPTKESIWKG